MRMGGRLSTILAAFVAGFALMNVSSHAWATELDLGDVWIPVSNPPNGVAEPAEIEAEAQEDAADAGSNTCQGRPVTIAGTNGEDHIDGTSNQDVILAKDGPDLVDAFGSIDYVCGGLGADLIGGGPSGDFLKGGRGADYIVGHGGADVMWGGSNVDDLHGWSGDDHLYGGTNDDHLYDGIGADILEGGPGDDTYWMCRVTGGDGNDTIMDDEGENQVFYSSSYC